MNDWKSVKELQALCGRMDLIRTYGVVSSSRHITDSQASFFRGRGESEFLRELISIRDRVTVFARVTLRHLSSMFVFLSFSVFIFLL